MEVGLYGKLPSHGDFLRRRVPDEFLRIWDEWLQQSVAASRSALGPQWLEVYLTSPVWRFACDAGVCGPRTYAGLMAPSVDRVGRYFPLTLIWEVPEGVHPFSVAQRADRWFDHVERLLLETLAADHVDLEAFDEQLIYSTRELARVNWRSGVELDPNDSVALTNGAPAQWQLPLGTPSSFPSIIEQLLYARLRATLAPLSVLWTEGSALIEPSCLLLNGLPAPTSYAALLNGDWASQGWAVLHGRTFASPTHEDTWDDEGCLAYRSSAASDAGRARRVNQDALIERAEIGLWAVADGMGGHDQGEVASRMICDALAELVPEASLQSMIDQIVQKLISVNQHLLRAANRPVGPVRSGSTVALLAARGTQGAVLWIGDSRVYRLRRGELLQLTRDHVCEDEVMDNVITRAVGGDPDLAPDIIYLEIHAGDRFLICSDGLNHEIDDALIRRCLERTDPTECTRVLIDAALAGGGRDNVSVIVVDAMESEPA